jgi:hypothetical protein
LSQGKTLTEIREIIRDQNADWDYEAWDFTSYHNSGNQRFLNTNNGIYTDTTMAEYEANVEDYV